MADYWVSQTRKYCDFCRCWITDNKPSVEFHEKGRRHQENVKKKLRHITRASTQNQKNVHRVDATIQQMEAAAMESYRKDVENNADFSSMAINKKHNNEGASSSSSGIKKIWKESKTRDGVSYYFNIMTNERVWTPPRQGYLSIQEQRDQSDQEAFRQYKEVEKLKRMEGLKKLQEIEQDEMEAKARTAREKMKARRVVDDTPPETCGPLIEPGRTDPYGRWQVVKESEPVYDLQLPQEPEEYYEGPVVEYEPEPMVREFQEKTVEKIVDDEDEDASFNQTSFKKRKIGEGAKRNVRQRVDDE